MRSPAPAPAARGDTGTGAGLRMESPPARVLPRHLQLGEIQVRVTRPRLADRGERGARAIPVLALAELLFLPESDEKHALRRDAAYLVEHSRRACLALHVAGAQKLAKVTMRGLVEGLGGPG